MTTQQVAARSDNIEMNILSYGFDRFQTQFLEHRVFSKHDASVQAIYDRVRYNVKTFGLNDNVDINVTVSVKDGTVFENYALNTGNTQIAEFETINPAYVKHQDTATFLNSFELAKSIEWATSNILKDSTANNEYVQLSDDGKVATGVDFAFVRKFICDFIIDMGQFNVSWTKNHIEDAFVIHMSDESGIVLKVVLYNPNYRHTA